ncbi:hypothetical protein ACFC0M_06155 [Streptomyces sp. NPDC056149]|uniref:hypothetical protein n=1 Tax=Streptomyces sp. NPDC056149 TaxID=3345728 RepID=UPI0035DBCB02
MPELTAPSVQIADSLTHQLAHLARQIALLPPHDATQLIARVIEPDTGVLGGFTRLIDTSSRFAKHQAEQGALPPEVALDLGRASNDLHSIGDDLAEHLPTFQQVTTRPPMASAVLPAPAPLVVRRRR